MLQRLTAVLICIINALTLLKCKLKQMKIQTVEPRIVYTTRQLLPAAQKDVVPVFASHQSNIVHQFLCYCDSRYMGRTSQRLQQRINQHVSKTIFQRHILLKTEAHWPALASQSEALKLKLFPPLLGNISYKTRHVHVNTTMANFPFLPKSLTAFLLSTL